MQEHEPIIGDTAKMFEKNFTLRQAAEIHDAVYEEVADEFFPQTSTSEDLDELFREIERNIENAMHAERPKNEEEIAKNDIETASGPELAEQERNYFAFLASRSVSQDNSRPNRLRLVASHGEIIPGACTAEELDNKEAEGPDAA